MMQSLVPGSSAWRQLFDGFERSAFRCEALQEYQDPGDTAPFQAFLAGAPQPPGLNAGWAARVRAARLAGKAISRVRIVTEPLTGYTEWELAFGYAAGAAAGEDIRILREPSRLLAPRFGDSWLFDSARLLRLQYDAAGRMTGAVLDTGPAAVAEAAAWRDAALKLAMPYGAYMCRGLAHRAS